MKNRILKLLLVVWCISFIDNVAQPYIYYNLSYSDTVFGNTRQISRYNLSTNFNETFLKPAEYYDPIIDPFQSYLFVDIRNSLSFLCDCSDTSVHYELNNFWGVQVNEMLYSSERNKLFIFSDDYAKISVFDVLSGTIISELNLGKTAYSNDLMNPARSSFFSSDYDKIYFYNVDTNNISQVWTYSLETNQITHKQNLLELGGHSGSLGYSLAFGRNGRGIITSYPVYYGNPDQDFYYKFYDFDADTSSPFIYHDGESEAYFNGNGEFILIMETQSDTSTLEYYHTGEAKMYKTSTGQLYKTLTLPSKGIVYTFDNYPNNIYYVIDIEEPTRQIYTLKMDSIFNVLDLTSLNPSSAIVNSPPFTLTVYGHGFDSLSTVYFNDTAKTTTYILDSVLTAEISTSDISVVGNYPVWVTDEWGISDTLTFEVIPLPELSSISPGLTFTPSVLDINNGYAEFTVTATGGFFAGSSVVYFNGAAKETSFQSDTSLTFQLNADDIPDAGNYSVWVNNYGSISDTLYFTVADTLPQSIIPVCNCIEDEKIAHFGYSNGNEVSVYIPVSLKNYFTYEIPHLPVEYIDRTQPTVFLPGINSTVFNIEFEEPIVDDTWHLNEIPAIPESRRVPPCE